MILAGDIGGTKTNLGLFDVQQGNLVRVANKRYPSREHKGLEEIVQDFVSGIHAKVTAASFGIAGPVVDNRVRAGNLPWIIDGATIAKLLGLERVRLMNDLEATAHGISVMGPGDLETLVDGVPAPQAPRVVIAAGTGLGEAILFWDGTKHVPTATEGGHADFAPHTEQQVELWRFIKARSEFVSNELLLSGRGFKTIHEFLNPAVRHAGFDDPGVDPAPEITRLALEKQCPVCVAALELWVEIYGSEAGNLVVRTVARGGVYVAGGIAVKILPILKDGRFVAAFRQKEKMTDFLAQVPIHVILDEECPLKGAAYAASRTL
ncbi:MAG TPA: glucokinase [Candidatus Acidoferrales bacterium]|nr:glucokinase [Candidatus Acidoferrales bacterium]